jgi:hypothetical protein
MLGSIRGLSHVDTCDTQIKSCERNTALTKMLTVLTNCADDINTLDFNKRNNKKCWTDKDQSIAS